VDTGAVSNSCEKHILNSEKGYFFRDRKHLTEQDSGRIARTFGRIGALASKRKFVWSTDFLEDKR